VLTWKKEEKLGNDAENNTVIAVEESKYVSEISLISCLRHGQIAALSVSPALQSTRLNQQICKQGSK